MLWKRISLIVVLLLVFIGSYAQKATVTGIISDERGNPIEKALAADDATGFGVYTDCNGVYNIDVPSGQSITLIYYASGFKAVRRQLQLAPGAMRTMDVQLDKRQTQEGVLISVSNEPAAEAPDLRK